ncbi:hypothetical protein ABUK32_19880 [Xanthomonas citri pv. mangiferaeindicae]|uniref:hypothetical protein n=1 Tax=Xanthomonas citri TaxID=346 RepID=UPI0035E6DB37
MSASVVSHIDTYHTVIGGRRVRIFRVTVRVDGRVVEQSVYGSRRDARALVAAAVEFYAHG